MSSFKCALVCGTRPEILKIAPVVNELIKRNIDYSILFTNQHFSDEMGKNFFNELGIEITHRYKSIFKRDLVNKWLKNKLKEYKPDIVLIVGDTTSALLGAMAGAFIHIKVGHIEAGLRSHDFEEPFPEEYNRCIIDSISDFHFCPTANNFKNLMTREHTHVHITGNPIIDLIKGRNQSVSNGKNIIVSSHRRENWKRIEGICKGIVRLSKELKNYNFIFVRHVNKELAMKIEKYLSESTVKIIPPQSYNDFIKLIAHSSFIISDSGGIVEEASYLNKPVSILREKTERPEAIYSKHANIVGTNEDFWKEVITFMNYRKKHNPEECPFGDGNASERIVDILENELK